MSSASVLVVLIVLEEKEEEDAAVDDDVETTAQQASRQSSSFFRLNLVRGVEDSDKEDAAAADPGADDDTSLSDRFLETAT